jgi:hypothetical protein
MSAKFAMSSRLREATMTPESWLSPEMQMLFSAKDGWTSPERARIETRKARHPLSGISLVCPPVSIWRYCLQLSLTTMSAFTVSKQLRLFSCT